MVAAYMRLNLQKQILCDCVDCAIYGGQLLFAACGRWHTGVFCRLLCRPKAGAGILPQMKRLEEYAGVVRLWKGYGVIWQ